MEHIYEEIKERHHQKLRVPAAIISSIMFTFLITVFLMMTNNYIQSSKESDQNLSVVSNTAENNLSIIAASN
ncbi:MAG TPA: hypothetical protein VJA82_12625 [Sediminibacterium sp.]|uniref:hypothetical protein n=1 Tax=Sediminibacterium sp. TaxID=1917865 RepID=UPI0008AF3DEE|nr:hypothetical protein [Sediminibacterium sp.]OHC86433.1 MAG: hypothetical protein A2472_02355 [Sphingobacteriia bacterium RIFOXYC2_FULL_35_18]OHC89945.1 MAG: hypothetical protein A2546_11605 [Sphingobacteriia bacterium RIFOXYD2_FULL_35_12]HLD54145.1 hypothetical protein [Sediminibacterium sp.]